MLHYRPQTKLREGNVFTPVCDSVHRGGLCPGGSLSKWGGSLSRGVSVMETPPGTVEQRAVRILLECILVMDVFKRNNISQYYCKKITCISSMAVSIMYFDFSFRSLALYVIHIRSSMGACWKIK